MALRQDPRAGRPVVAYDDISLPYDEAPAGQSSTSGAQPSTSAKGAGAGAGQGGTGASQAGAGAGGKPPPAKKRKGNKKNRNQQHQQHQQHWDDSGSSHGVRAPPAPGASQNGTHGPLHNGAATTSYGEAASHDAAPSTSQNPADEEESRVLTYEEIWDDSALIDAWEAANEEYEAYHGKGKSWKNEPVHKSVLWYNVPPAAKPAAETSDGVIGIAAGAIAQAMARQEQQQQQQEQEQEEENGHQQEGDVEAGQSAAAYAAGTLAPADLAGGHASGVGQDEAFSRAMNAMYWTGYWTAVYHTARGGGEGPRGTKRDAEEMEEVEEELEEVLEDETGMEEDGFVPSQR
ncbi:hypothetical protein HDZ31DRAFT_84667 [Schizophyllum fasciatum]